MLDTLTKTPASWTAPVPPTRSNRATTDGDPAHVAPTILEPGASLGLDASLGLLARRRRGRRPR